MNTKTTVEVPTAAIDWLASGDSGLSSEAIFFHMIGATNFRKTHPLDPGDLGRCLRLLEAAPEWKARMPEMASVSKGWALLVPHWNVLAKLMDKEVGIDWSKGKRATTTYHAMKNILHELNY